jgi:hypothetical protein
MPRGLALAGSFDAVIHLLHVVEVAAGAEPLTVHYESQLLVKDVERVAWEELQRLMPEADQRRASPNTSSAAVGAEADPHGG